MTLQRVSRNWAVLRLVTYKLVVALVLTGLFHDSLLGQTVWNGSTGGSWGVDGNWTPNLVPTQLEDVTINAGQAIIGAALVAESRALLVGDTSSGALRIESGGSLTSREATLGGQFGSTGSLTVNASTWNILGDTVVGLAGNGTLVIESGSSVESLGSVYVAQGAGSVGNLTIDGGSSELIAQGGVDVGDPNASSTGILNVRNNGKLSTPFLGDIQINGTGVVNVESGSSIVTDLFTAEAGSLLVNHGTIDDPNGAFISLVANSGTLSGSGSQSVDLTDFGVLAPSAVSPIDDSGVYTINASWDQFSGSELQIELGGLSNGGGNKSLTSFDWIDATGDVTLAGGIDVQLIDGFTLSFQQEFEIVNVGGTLSGGFVGLAEESVVTVLGGMPVLISYQGGDGNDIVLYTPSEFEADFDSDNDVDSDDLGQWQGDYASNGMSDADGDGDSDGLDFLTWQKQHGYGIAPLSSASTPVPEPAVGSMILLTTVITFLRRAERARSLYQS